MTEYPSLPEKGVFTLDEIAERWKTDKETLRYWSDRGLLHFAFRIKNAPSLIKNRPSPIYSREALRKRMALLGERSIDVVPAITREERDRFEAEHRIGAHAGDLPKMGSDPRERRALLNIIGAMLEMMKSPRPGRDTDTAVIAELLNNWPEKYGISDRNLKAKFAEAKRSLNDDD